MANDNGAVSMVVEVGCDANIVVEDMLESFEHRQVDIPVIFFFLRQAIYNALDAGAKKIKIFFVYEHQGRKKELTGIAVVDDGNGFNNGGFAAFLSLGKSSKKNDPKKIGHRGTGAKSGLCLSPLLVATSVSTHFGLDRAVQASCDRAHLVQLVGKEKINPKLIDVPMPSYLKPGKPGSVVELRGILPEKLARLLRVNVAKQLAAYLTDDVATMIEFNDQPIEPIKAQGVVIESSVVLKGVGLVTYRIYEPDNKVILVAARKIYICGPGNPIVDFGEINKAEPGLLDPALLTNRFRGQVICDGLNQFRVTNDSFGSRFYESKEFAILVKFLNEVLAPLIQSRLDVIFGKTLSFQDVFQKLTDVSNEAFPEKKGREEQPVDGDQPPRPIPEERLVLSTRFEEIPLNGSMEVHIRKPRRGKYGWTSKQGLGTVQVSKDTYTAVYSGSSQGVDHLEVVSVEKPELAASVTIHVDSPPEPFVSPPCADAVANGGDPIKLVLKRTNAYPGVTVIWSLRDDFSGAVVLEDRGDGDFIRYLCAVPGFCGKVFIDANLIINGDCIKSVSSNIHFVPPEKEAPKYFRIEGRKFVLRTAASPEDPPAFIERSRGEVHDLFLSIASPWAKGTDMELSYKILVAYIAHAYVSEFMQEDEGGVISSHEREDRAQEIAEKLVKILSK